MRIFICAALGALWFVAGTAQATTIFEGRLVVTSAVNCVDSGVGESLSSLYHIANLDGNAGRTSLTMVRDLNAEGYQINGQRFTGIFKTVEGVETGSGAHAFSAQVRITQSTPPTANITAATNFVSLLGQIKNRRDDTNGLSCVVTFRASYARRIE